MHRSVVVLALGLAAACADPPRGFYRITWEGEPGESVVRVDPEIPSLYFGEAYQPVHEGGYFRVVTIESDRVVARRLIWSGTGVFPGEIYSNGSDEWLTLYDDGRIEREKAEHDSRQPGPSITCNDFDQRWTGVSYSMQRGTIELVEERPRIEACPDRMSCACILSP